MLRDNLAGLIEPKLNSAGAYPLALGTDRKESSDDRPHHALKIPARQGGIYALTENVASPFHAEPRHNDSDFQPGAFTLSLAHLSTTSQRYRERARTKIFCVCS